MNNRIDLRLTLIDSAQCFSWREDHGVFYGVVNGTPYALTQENCACLPEYLDLGRDYELLEKEFCGIEPARLAFARFPGIRILRQDPWETVVSFLISANNNVGRIRGIIAKLSAAYGERYEINGTEVFGFPAAERLAEADAADFRALGLGYRAPYLSKTARAVADGFPLAELASLPYAEAHKRLTGLAGVGDKVADCIQLFGLGHTDAFPVDVWVSRFMEHWFGVTGTPARVSRIAREMFGPNCGILQQYLFHAARMGLLDEYGRINNQ